MKPATPLRGPHDLGEIIGYAYRVYIRDFAAFFGLALLSVPLQLLSGAVEQRVSSGDRQAVQLLFQVPAIVVQLVITGAIVVAADRSASGERPSFTGALDTVFERFWALVGTTLLAAYRAILAIFAVPFLAIYWLIRRDATIDGRRDWWFALVPFSLLVYLVVRWMFTPQAVMIAGRRGWAALDDSAGAVRGYWWRTLGITIMLSLLTVGPLLIASPAGLLDPLPAAAILGTVQALTLPFYGIGQTLLYFDLKARQAVHTAATDPDEPGTVSVDEEITQ